MELCKKKIMLSSRLFGFFITLLALSSIFLAEEVKAIDGSSGCGPGWYVLKDNSMLSSALRATTNGILFPSSTIGMTFGTSNCTKHSLVLKEKESLYFITQNFYDLQNQISQGKGEYLQAFADVVGCRGSSENFNYLSNALQREYHSIYNDDISMNKNSKNLQNENVLKKIYFIIINDSKLTKYCSIHQA